ncbi:stimulated by retinoic acid 6 protein [Biomphalaria glabrata]|nr:putative stimulated by retinoic acid gene 6 protein [Biomphalaria glabrata]
MDLDNFNIYIINLWMLLVVAPVILLLSFIEKRKNRRDICHGRPALVIPFSFLDGYDNRTAYAMAFGTITSTIVSLVTSKNTLGFDMPLWGRAIYVYLQAFVGCLTCFPLFACLSTRYRVVGAVVCILYSAVWLSLNIVDTIQGVQESANTTYWFVSANDSVSQDLNKATAALQGLPIICCYVVLIGYCIYVIQRCFRTKVFLNKQMMTTIKPHQEEHVRWVLRKSKNSTSSNFWGDKTFVQQMHESRKLKLFTSFPFFKYPTRIFAIAFVQLNVIYWMGMLLISGTLQILYTIFHLVLQKTEITSSDKEQVALVSICASVSLLASISNSLTHIFMATRNYRYHMLRLYQGDKTFLPQMDVSSQYLLTSSMIYPGYQVAFMMWGLVLSFGFVLIITLLIAEPIYFFIAFDMIGDVLLSIVQLLSFPVMMLVLFYLQVYLCNRLLLQDKIHESDKQRPLNVNNRKFYELVNYYSLFTNMAVGLFTCLLRIFLSAIFGIFSVDRLDKSVFTRDKENYDNGYRAYVSMLLVDNAHNNPSMRVFAHLLWTQALAARFRASHREVSHDATPLCPNSPHADHISYGAASPTGSETSAESLQNLWTLYDTKRFSVSKLARTRWFLLYTLIHNPQLSKLRKRRLVPSNDSSLINIAEDTTSPAVESNISFT